jgi:uncharacterized protein (TIGR00299 family) protein
VRVAIFDPFSGISGDMTLGALLGLGLNPEFLRALPARLGLENITVTITQVMRADLQCWKVDFGIPPQPHGRHLHHIAAIIEKSDAPPSVKHDALAAFTAITQAEADIHGKPIEKVHLHEVGSVDAILDIIGSIWGLAELGVEEVRCGVLRTGDGTVTAAHGVLPVPAPATLILLAGLPMSPGPEGSGELVTPTGAALMKVLSAGPPPEVFTPIKTGYGAGTKEFKDRANALRVTLADVGVSAPGNREHLTLLACDIDDMSPEYVAGVADRLRSEGALDVFLLPVTMKKGRAGTRVEVLCSPSDVDRLEQLLLAESTTIGVRRCDVSRNALPRKAASVSVLGESIAVKVVTLPDGSTRAKPEFEDVRRVALATRRRPADIYQLALAAAERL